MTTTPDSESTNTTSTSTSTSTSSYDAAAINDATITRSAEMMVVDQAESLARVREMPGLSAEQRRWLAQRLLTASDRECCRLAEVHVQRLWEWRHNDAIFQREYERLQEAKTDELFNRLGEQLARVAQQVPRTVEQLLTAETPITDKTGAVVGQRADWNARAKGVESLQRAAGLWNPQDRGGGANQELLRYLNKVADIQARAQQVEAAQQAQPGSAEPAGSAHIIEAAYSEAAPETEATHFD